ncbi:MAG TPA: hypothetical protein VHY22_07945 [Chthoniobacteraceae bacterium]|jgi:hypothetical protein|nr:hypothetical protein [Chthoniobacteraceae bacterium]
MTTAPPFWQTILVHLKQPEYVHVLLNPLPIYGIALGALALAIAMAMRNRRAHILALILILIGAGSTIPVRYYGDAGYDVVESRMSSDQADAWLDAHGQRALKAMPAFYTLIAMALVALLVPWKWPKSAWALNALTLALAIFCFGLTAWIGFAGGQAMHEEFRSGNMMPPEPQGGYDKMR